MHWFTISWWKYLLQKPNECGAIVSFICRAKGHPCGVWFYNSGGLVPDMRCKNCGDYLG